MSPAARCGRAALAAAGGVAMAVALSGWNFAWLGWLALVPFFLALHGVGRRFAAVLGFILGSVHVGLHWSWLATTIAFMSGGRSSGVPHQAMLSLVFGICLAVYGVCHVMIVRRATSIRGLAGRLLAVLAVASLWVVFEFGMDHLNERASLFFIPDLGMSQWHWPACLQIAAVTGIYGVSFLLAAWSMGCVVAWRASDWRVAAATTLLVALCVGAGALRLLAGHTRQTARPVRVALLQGNVDPYDKLDGTKEKAIAERYFDLCRQATRAKADLVVWTEGSIPWAVADDDPFVERALALTASANSAHLLGMWLHVPGAESNVMANAALLALPDGRVTGAYRKIALIPFSERPVRWGRNKASVAPEEIKVRFEPGDTPEVLRSPVGAIGVTICNESCYASFSRNLVRLGADFLVNIGNDAWFPGTQAMRQHFGTIIVRAVEFGRWHASANNAGISAIVDDYGRIVTSGEPKTTTCVVGELLPSGQTRTFYARHGDGFAALCFIALVVLAVIPRTARDRAEP